MNFSEKGSVVRFQFAEFTSESNVYYIISLIFWCGIKGDGKNNWPQGFWETEIIHLFFHEKQF